MNSQGKMVEVNAKQKHQPVNILLFDTDHSFDNRLIEVLEEKSDNTATFSLFDHTLTLTSSPDDVFEAIQCEAPDVVLTSVLNENSENLDFIRTLRALSVDLPIVAIGRSTNPQPPLEAIKVGAQDCIFIDSDDRTRVIKTIQYAIERRRISTNLLNLHMNQMTATIEAVSDGILIASADKKVLFANKAAEQLLWKTSKELLNLPVPLPVTPGRRTRYVVTNPFGEEIDLEVTTAFVPWQDGDAGYCITLHDVTESTRAQRELQKAADIKDEFIAHISHELRTPMNGIIGMTSLLSQENLSENVRNFVDTIRSSGETMLNIINDLLDMSKIEAGKLELEYSEFDVESLVEQTLEIFSPIARQKRIFFTCQVDRDVPKTLIGDHSRIRQVLANLVSNAVKFTDLGHVFVNVALAGDHKLLFTVRDTGTGIPKKKHGLVFQPFTQLSTDPEKKAQGTGLGLVISKKLTHLMGGDIKFESESEQGSVFEFTVNVVSKYSAGKHAEKPPIKRDCTIGVTNCTREDFQIYAQVLGQYYHRIIQIEESNLDKGELCDLVLIDNKELIHESEFTELIHSLRSHKDVSVIIMGRLNFNRDVLEGLKASSLLRYPLRFSQLRTFIDEYLSGSSTQNFLTNEMDRQQKISIDFVPCSFKGKRVLVAEDNMINQKVIMTMLDQLGLECDAVSNGQEALEAAKSYKYDAVLMDCRMPVMNGYEAARGIRRLNAHYRTCPIIAVSANALKSERLKSDAALMDMHLPKPITIQDLKGVLQKYLSPEAKQRQKNSCLVIKRAQQAVENQPVLNKDTIASLEMVGEKAGTDLLGEVFNIFVSSTPELLRNLSSAISNDSYKEIESLAHKLKGSARNIGATKLSNLCERIESDGGRKVIKEKEHLPHMLQGEFQEVVRYIETNYRQKQASKLNYSLESHG